MLCAARSSEAEACVCCVPDLSTWEDITSTKYKLDAHSKGLQKDECWLGLGVLAVVQFNLRAHVKARPGPMRA